MILSVGTTSSNEAYLYHNHDDKLDWGDIECQRFDYALRARVSCSISSRAERDHPVLRSGQDISFISGLERRI